jgi:predicted helicase
VTRCGNLLAFLQDVVDLIAKVTTVAVETMKIVDGLAEIG